MQWAYRRPSTAGHHHTVRSRRDFGSRHHGSPERYCRSVLFGPSGTVPFGQSARTLWPDKELGHWNQRKSRFDD
ncbi:hypothetical protein ABT279_33905 [Amycolatopsis sp. NPDC000673]|uniref:hypothetical protein n=1 Tax=unclassified Amycolatopsis TaxID=2618356 RepID=UPI0033294D1F